MFVIHINKLLEIRLPVWFGEIVSRKLSTRVCMGTESADYFMDLVETNLFIIFALWELLSTILYWV